MALFFDFELGTADQLLAHFAARVVRSEDGEEDEEEEEEGGEGEGGSQDGGHAPAKHKSINRMVIALFDYSGIGPFWTLQEKK